jgi:hypothetical protein
VIIPNSGIKNFKILKLNIAKIFHYACRVAEICSVNIRSVMRRKRRNDYNIWFLFRILEIVMKFVCVT